MPFEIIYGLGALILALALGWGLWRNATRNRANDALTEKATAAEYSRPETYDQVEQKLRDEVKPS